MEFSFSPQVAEDAVFAAECAYRIEKPGGQGIGVDGYCDALEATGTHEFAFHFLL